MIDKTTKTRIVITIDKKLKQKLDECAREENRTTSNFINTLIITYLNNKSRD